MIAALLLTTLPSAHADLGGAMDGLYAQGTLGVQAAAPGAPEGPVAAAVSWSAALGVWRGRYDHDFSLGRSWGVGLRVTSDTAWRDGEVTVRTAPQLEVRRTVDLLVVGLHAGLQGGPLFASDAAGPLAPTRLVGGTVRAAAGARYRFDWGWGVVLRLEAGVDVTSRVTPAVGLSLGLEHARPSGRDRP